MSSDVMLHSSEGKVASMRTSGIDGVVERVARVGLLVGAAEAVGEALEGAQELVALNLCQLTRVSA